MNYYSTDIETNYGDYKLYFYPRTTSGTFTTEVELPEDFILKDITFISSTELGYANSNKLNIKVNLDAVETALADLIIDGGTNWLYRDRVYFLGWVWELTKDGDIIFQGCQSGLEEVDEFGIYSIELEGIEKTVCGLFLETLNYGTADVVANNENPVIIGYTAYGDDIRIVYNDFAGVEFRYWKIDSLISRMQHNATIVYLELRRKWGGVALNMNWNWVFKKQDLSTAGESTGTLDFEDLYILGEHVDGHVDAGALDANDKDNIFEYGTINGFFRSFCNTFLLNGKWSYGTNLTLTFKKFWNETEPLDDLNYVAGSLKIRKREYQIDSALADVKGADVDDINQYTVRGDIDGDSADVQLMFNNNALRISEAIKNNYKQQNFRGNFNSPMQYGMEKAKMEDVRTMYYLEGTGKFRMRRVHGDCSVDIGLAGAVNTATVPNYPPKTIEGHSINRGTTLAVLETELARASLYGMGYVWTHAMFSTFNKNGAGVEFQSTFDISASQSISEDDIFRGFEIDFTGISPYGFNNIGTKFFINSLEIDYYGMITIKGILI